jgi:hypothetical protein
MSNPVVSLLGGPITSVLKGAGDLVDRFVTTDKEKLEAKAILLEIERKANADLLEADARFAEAQSRVIVAEAKSESWLARSWRPLTMLSFVVCILYAHLLAPMFSLPSSSLPVDLWEVIKVGVGGYVIGRSAEKVAPVLADAFKKKESTK